MLKHFSLFTGIGGIDLAAEWAGFETVGQCEWADYPTKVLEKHWPNVPRWRDIRDVTADSIRERGIGTVDVISGGFPCQPFSVAGKRRGKEDDRYLWPEMLRVISEIKPTWVIGENVAGIVNMALDQVQTDLESQGYTTQSFIIPAAGVGAQHRRYRVFIVAHSNDTWSGKQKHKVQTRRNTTKPSSKIMANATSVGQQRQGESIEQMHSEQNREWETIRSFDVCFGEIWETEPNVDRVVDGFSSKLDRYKHEERLKALGNAVVPAQIYPIFKAIADIEGGLT